MIHIICPGSQEQAGIIVTSAFQRSCGLTQITNKSFSYLANWLEKPENVCLVIIDPPEEWSTVIINVLNTGLAKVLLLGRIPLTLANFLDVISTPLTPEIVEAAKCEPAPTNGFSESRASVNYYKSIANVASPIPRRSLQRFDFTDEWNNLGFGAIRADNSIWSVSQSVTVPEHSKVAGILISGTEVTAYAAMWDLPKSSLLWFNRSVGPVDSQEWRLIEVFVANHRSSELPCWPIISEVPYGYSAAVTMRLDCDEDVESARELWNTYQTLNISFSLALHSAVLSDSRHHQLPKEILTNGGAVLSHTATHAPDWGGSYEAAFNEGLISINSIKEATGHTVRYAVSPFHQTPIYARKALADAGYEGCIGGIIRNDPDFLMARAGIPPGSSKGFVGHSQQCMLHGDCMLEIGDPLKIFKQAFDYAEASQTLFGYLDHPFSERYQYGWLNEQQRIKMHEEFISYMQNSGNVLFCNENDAMDFIQYKTSICVTEENNNFHITNFSNRDTKWAVAVEYAGTLYKLTENGIIL